MALTDYKITAEDTENKKIADIEGDTMTGTPAENKAKFDEYCELIKERFNTLVDLISDSFAVNGTGYKINSSAIDMATTSLKGLMSASDKAKLDSIGLATTSQEGLMSASDKAKMDNLKVAVANVTSGITNPPTSGAVYDAIQRIAGIATDTADYVVSFEEGISDSGARYSWDRRRWASGVCEIWFSNGGYDYTFTDANAFTQDSNTGIFYFDCDRFRYPPNTFVDAPAEFVSLEGCGARSWLASRNAVSYENLKYGTQGYTIMRLNQNSANTTYYFTVYAIGRWK